jgi:hypothetical protein
MAQATVDISTRRRDFLALTAAVAIARRWRSAWVGAGMMDIDDIDNALHEISMVAEALLAAPLPAAH